jgi:hypothetical protein
MNQAKAFVTITGIDPEGRYCSLDDTGRFTPCDPSDGAVMALGRMGSGYSMTAGDLSSFELDLAAPVSAGRIYIAREAPLFLSFNESTGDLVQPDPSNPDDPNNQLTYDWVEFAVDEHGFHANTTTIDQFGFPILLSVSDRARPDEPPAQAGIIQSREELFRAFREEMPPLFHPLADPGGRRIVAPMRSEVFRSGPGSTFFDTYVRSLWEKHKNEPLVLTPDEGTFRGRVQPDGSMLFKRDGDPGNYVIPAMPTTAEIFLCDGVLAQGNPLEKVLGAQIAALINRHLLETPLEWRNASLYFQGSPCNEYARFWHNHAIGGKAYGFPYDDVNGQSPSIYVRDPSGVVISYRWD